MTLFTMENFKTTTHRGVTDPNADKLITWFNVDGKANADNNKTDMLDHADHKNLYISENISSWTADLYEDINGKTFMNYPSNLNNNIRKNLGVQKITEMHITFIVDSLPINFGALATTQGALTKYYGGITIWITSSNKIGVQTTFRNSETQLVYFNESIGSLVEVGREYTVKVKINEGDKSVIVNINGVDTTFQYDPTWYVDDTTEREVLIGGYQTGGTAHPPADFKLHEVKVYK